MTNRKHKPRRALTQEERIAAADRELERIDRDLTRRIRAWAKTWETCVVAGCRRNKRCLHEKACRMHSDKPWTEEDRAMMRDAIAAMDDNPKYDGETVR